jgi:hypothetical protein
MKPKLLHRLLYSVFGGIPALYFVWLGSTEVVAQANSSAMAFLLLAASAAATVAGWLVILGLGSSHRVVRLLLTTLISVGVAIAVALTIFAMFGLAMLPALVGIFLLTELWSSAQPGIQADAASPRRLT